MIKYRTSGWLKPIEEVEIERETESSVFFHSGRREAKQCRSGQYFDSWEEAYRDVIKGAISKIKYAQVALSNAEEDLVKLRTLTKEDSQ
jgi:hypothetical protein